MLMAEHKGMISSKTRHSEIRYRKMPEPFRMVPLSYLKVTDSTSRIVNNGPIVSHSGTLNAGQSWHPIRRATNAVEISPGSWTGLHSRMVSSMKVKVEAS